MYKIKEIKQALTSHGSSWPCTLWAGTGTENLNYIHPGNPADQTALSSWCLHRASGLPDSESEMIVGSVL